MQRIRKQLLVAASEIDLATNPFALREEDAEDWIEGAAGDHLAEEMELRVKRQRVQPQAEDAVELERTEWLRSHFPGQDHAGLGAMQG
jgi:hypothetical protein